MTEDHLSAKERSRLAWREFCAALQDEGDRIVDDGQLGDREVAEGYRHLSRLARLALELHLEYGDATHPRMVNHERPSLQWGGPNPDNYYLRAAIDPRDSYRVWGDVTGVEQAIFSLMEGDMALGRYGVHSETTLADLDVADGHLEFVISSEHVDGDRMPMHPDATNLTVRVFQSDPTTQPAPYLHIERIGATSSAPPALDAGRLVSGLGDAAGWVTASARYWRAYMERFAASPNRNELSAPSHPPGGADNILYGGGMWELDEGEALLVESAVPDAAYWNFTVHTYPWFESGDHERRGTSVNHRSAHVDPDGRVRVVVAHTDPGVPNWIDTEGRRESLLTYRWIDTSDAPHPRTLRTTVDDLRDELPDDHPTVTADQRRDSLARRAEALRERYR